MRLDTNAKKRLGDFEIIRELGRGGMGIVYEARQRSLNRKVALKVLSSGLGMTSKAVIRFRREAETAAKLHHTNIVPIHATGEEDGTHFYAMELVDGPSLNLVIRDMCDRRRVHPSDNPASRTIPRAAESAVEATGTRASHQASLEETATCLPEWVERTMTFDTASTVRTSRTSVGESSSTITAGHGYFDNVARMMADVADALDYAHSQGVVHRDMKPSNLLLSPDGRLSINDFGLARMLEQPGMTTTGEFMGSPLYMSPEQITAGRAPLDHRTDIYSLGATLYELLTLQPPFLGDRRDQVIAQIMHKEPRSPRSVNKKVPVDLETICLKAMEKDPDRRYQTSGDMAEDLRRFVNRFAISARRIGIVGRTGKWIRRHRAVAALAGLFLVAGAAAGVFAYSAHRSNVRMMALQRDTAKERAILAAMNGEFARAEEAIQEAELHGASAGWVRMLRGQVAIHQNQPSLAIAHLEQAIRLLPQNVAAKAMLALAVLYDGRWDHAVLMLKGFEELAPRSAEDHVFLGWVHSSFGDAANGLRMLDEAVRMRPASPMVRVVRAEMRAFNALDEANLKRLDEAIADANTARGMLPDSLAAVQTHLYVYLVALSLYDETGNESGVTAALQELEQDARALEQFRGHPNAHYYRAMYFQRLGRDDDALEEWSLATLGEYANDEMFRQYAFALYRNGDYTEALSVANALCERSHSAHGELTRALILLLIQGPDARETAMAAYRAAMAKETSTVMRISHQVIPYIAGERQTVVEACRSIDTNLNHLPEHMRLWYGTALDFVCRRATPDELLTKAGGHRTREIEACFLLGALALSDGDRAQAKEYFRRGLATGVFNYWDWDWSRLALEKLTQDPAWPPWIPLQNVPSESEE